MTTFSAVVTTGIYCRPGCGAKPLAENVDRKSTRLNSSHSQISYAVFCLKKKRTRFNSSYSQIWYPVFCFKDQNHMHVQCDTHEYTLIFLIEFTVLTKYNLNAGVRYCHN